MKILLDMTLAELIEEFASFKREENPHTNDGFVPVSML